LTSKSTRRRNKAIAANQADYANERPMRNGASVARSTDFFPMRRMVALFVRVDAEMRSRTIEESNDDSPHDSPHDFLR